MQIALDSARGLEYIHEHTVPVYVHRDIKSANILIDQNFRAKVRSQSLIAKIIGVITVIEKELEFLLCHGAESFPCCRLLISG